MSRRLVKVCEVEGCTRRNYTTKYSTFKVCSMHYGMEIRLGKERCYNVPCPRIGIYESGYCSSCVSKTIGKIVPKCDKDDYGLTHPDLIYY